MKIDVDTFYSIAHAVQGTTGKSVFFSGVQLSFSPLSSTLFFLFPLIRIYISETRHFPLILPQGVRYFAAADNCGVFVTESKVTKMSNSNNGNSESATAPPAPVLAEVRRTPASSRPASATVRRSETMRSSRQQLRLQVWDLPIKCF